ncbi:hypothetical protein AB0J14_15790 [Micromonospora arborensis]|uniref:hypothetical protein n=1 Tax=Micromonospora arborensis TaxID=2116518 RepID=UPI0033F5ED79
MSIEIAEGIREVEADTRRVARQRAVQVAGGVLATVAATLVAIEGQVFQEVLPILGATGGIWGLVAASTQSRQEKAAIEAKPFYFLWLLERRAQHC